jgi:radical SAM protein with 4Fe4S-binding SPASM domain
MRHLSVYSKYAHYLRQFATVKKMSNIALNKFELYQKKSNLKSKPFKITIDPGNFCNLRCPGCHTGIKHTEMITPSFISTENYKIIFDQISDYALSVALYNWGEPFLNKNIFDIISYTSSKSVGSTIHTNFNYFTESMAIDAVKSGLTHVYLSIDGSTQENYVKYRVKGSLDKVLKNLKILLDTKKRLNSKYPLVTWKFLSFAHNKHEINDAKILSEKMGVDAFETFVGLPKLMDIYDEAELYKNDPSSFNLGTCNSLWSSLYVNADGSIMPCSLAYRPNEVFGNLLYDDFDSVWNNMQFTGARSIFTKECDQLKVPKPCNSCKFFINKQCGN